MSTLKELWYGNISPAEYSREVSEEYLRLSREIVEAEHALVDDLPEKKRQQYDELIEAYSRRECVNEADIFAKAFRLGAQIMMDVFCGE